MGASDSPLGQRSSDPTTRRISSIRRDVQLNGQLWDLAAQVLAA